MTNRDLDLALTIRADGGEAVEALQDVAQATGQVGEAGQAAAESLGEVGSSAEAAGGSAGDSNQQLQNMTNTLLSFDVVGRAIDLVADKLGEIADMADEWSNLQAKVQLATGEHGNLAAAMERVRAIADSTSTDVTATADLYSTLTRALKSLGDTQTDVAALTQTINQSFQVSGASAAETSGTITQLAQALASGQLRGDEFNSVMEQAPRLAQAMADALGVTTGELRSMAEEGKLTAQAVIAALKEQSATIQTEYDALPDTIGRATTRLRNSVLAFVGDLDASTGASERFAEASEAVASGINLIADNIGAVASVLGAAGLGLLAGQATTAAAAVRGLATSLAAASASGLTTATAMTALSSPLAGMAAGVSLVVGYQLGAWLREVGVNALYAAEEGTLAAQAFDLLATAAEKAELHLKEIGERSADKLKGLSESTGLAFRSMEDFNKAAEKGAVVWDAATQSWKRGAVSLETARAAVTNADAALSTQADTLAEVAKQTAAGLDLQRQSAELSIKRAQAAGDEAGALQATVEASKQQAAAAVIALGMAKQDLALSEQRLTAMDAEAKAGGRLNAAKQAEVAELRTLVAEKRLAVRQAELGVTAAGQEVQKAKEAEDAYASLTAALKRESDARIAHLRLLKAEAEARGDTITAARIGQQIGQDEIGTLNKVLTVKRQELDQAKESVAAKIQEADADGQRTAEEAAGIEQLKQGVAAKELEVAGIVEAITAKQAENQEEQAGTQSKQEGADANEQVADSLDKVGEAAKATKGNADVLKWAISQAIDELSQYSQAAGTAVQAIIDGFDTWAAKTADINRLSAADFVDPDGFTDAKQQIAELEAKAKSLAEEARHLKDTADDFGPAWTSAFYQGLGAIKDFQARVIEAQVVQAKLELGAEQMGRALDALTSRFDNGELGLSDYIRKLEQLESSYAQLGDERLDGLRDALRQAKEDMEAFSASTRDGLLDLRREWASLNDQKLIELDLEQQAQRAEIELQLLQAKQDGNGAAIANLQQQLVLLDQIYAKRRADEAAQEAQDAIDAAQAAADEAERVAGLSDEERRYEETLKTLKAQLAEAIKANDAVVQQSLLAQIAAETQRHEQAMANLEAERKAKEDTSGATSTNTSASTSTSSTGTASTSSGTTASTGASRGTGGNTVNFNIDGVLDISDRGTLDTLARRLRPILAELERKGVV